MIFLLHFLFHYIITFGFHKKSTQLEPAMNKIKKKKFIPIPDKEEKRKHHQG
jgi:hypothetical protein